MIGSNKKSKIVLSIDQSLTCSGWALVMKDTVIRSGRIVTKHNDEDPSNRRRLSFIFTEFRNLVDEFTTLDIRPDLIVLETFYGGSRHNGGNAIPEVRGVLKLLITQLCIPFAEYAPQTVRKHMVGTGKAKKPAVAAVAQRYVDWPITKKDYDVTDAIVMGLYAAKELKDETDQVVPATVGLAISGTKGTKGDNDHGK